MRKTAIILGTLLFLTVGVMITVYTVRKGKIKEQYVSESSTSVLSFAIDDLLLDNISSFITFNQSSSKDVEESDNWRKKIIWSAGISIPARMYLFTLPQNKQQFYGILDVNNYDNCFSFFATYFPDSINFIDKEQEIVSVAINKHLKLIFNRNHLVYQLTEQNNENFKDLQTLLQTPTTWTKVGALTEFENILSKKHISYIQKDNSLKIEATVSKNATEIEGEWTLSKELKNEFQVRKIDSVNQTMRFWSLLPLVETPTLSSIMSKYTGLDQNNLSEYYTDYFDLQIKNELTIQKDSSTSYSYDDDFNEIEEISIQEHEVPNIQLTWKYDTHLKKALPTSMFYKFNKQEITPYLISTTLETPISQIESTSTAYPLYFSINFENWPKMWDLFILKDLESRKIKAEIMATPKNEKTLSIKGSITY